MKVTAITITILAGLFAILPVEGAQKEEPGKISKATAILQPTEGNNAHGVVMFSRVKGGVKVVTVVEGLTTGVHGFHVHERGDCSAPDAESAGGHFNPQGSPHGGPADQRRHAGDLGNLEANVYGNVFNEQVDRVISLNGPDSIVGRAVVIHAGQDDFKTQPTGGSGARIACGVIRADKE